MNLNRRLGVFVGLAIVTLLMCYFFSEAKTNPVAGVVVWLPENIEGSVSQGGTMGEEEKRWLPGDTTFFKKTYVDEFFLEQAKREARRYRMLGGDENEVIASNILNWAWTQGVSATLIVAGSDSRSLHRPQVCLTAQHWTIERREIVRLDTVGGPLEVMNFHLSRSVRTADGGIRKDENGNDMVTRAHYVYWWIGPGSSTASDEERVWLEIWNSILKGRKERWAYPSVMVMVDPQKGKAEAQERAFDFIRQYAPSFQKSLGATERDDMIPLKEIGSE